MSENGLEVWRRLSRRYNPMTPMREMQIMLKVMLPPKIGKNQDVNTQVNKWESLINILERDYQEKVSDMMKVGLLIHVMPDDLQDTILQHADRLREYRPVKEKSRQSRGREGPAARSKCHGCRVLRISRGGQVPPRGG